MKLVNGCYLALESAHLTYVVLTSVKLYCFVCVCVCVCLLFGA